MSNNRRRSIPDMSIFTRIPPPYNFIIPDNGNEEEQLDRHLRDPSTQTGQNNNLLQIQRNPQPDLELCLGIPGTRNVTGQGISVQSQPFAANQSIQDECSSSTQSTQKKEVKLRCMICMDTMTQETSTLWGHLFCRPCIFTTIQEHTMCPACRQPLTLVDIHPIYFPAESNYSD